MKFIYTVVLLFLLTACGGGGSSSQSSEVSTNDNTSNTTSDITNTSSNNNEDDSANREDSATTVNTSTNATTSSQNNNPTEVETVSTKEAVFLDAIVEGVRYNAGSGIEGYTNANGVFKYIEGQSVKFYVGDVYLGEGHPVEKPTGVTAVRDKILTPLELASAGDDIDNVKALKLVRFLMALDRDDNASNGIIIDQNRISGESLTLLDSDLDTNFGNHLNLPTIARARYHFCQSLGRKDCSQAPLISGTPKTKTSVYDIYQFLPKVSDINDDSLLFTIKNKPLWAEFNTSTGLLSGMPMEEGNSTNIIISVSDGDESVELEAFSIEVKPEIDIAHNYGKAIQGTDSSYYYYGAASNTIDNNDSTYNHTRGGASAENWLEIELPNATKIAKIIIQNRGSHSSRLTNAKVYVSNTSYSGEVNEANLVETLIASTNEQIIEFEAFKSGTYVLIKGEETSNDNRHLHLKKVEVYGTTPNAPLFLDSESTFLLQSASRIGEIVTQVEGIDYQGDALTYSIINDVPFTVDAQGNVRVDGTLSASNYSIDVRVSDGINSTSRTLNVNVTSSNAVEEVLESGDVINTLITEEELIQAARDEIASLKVGNTLLSLMYENDAISYSTGGYYSQLINSYADASKNFPILYGNKNNVLAIAGTKEASRFSVFASNPLSFFDNNENLSFEPSMKRLIKWLIIGESVDLAFEESHKTIALSYANSSSAVERWLTSNYAHWTIKSCNDEQTLESCYAEADLILLGRSGGTEDAEALESVLAKILSEGKPVLYLHNNWGENTLSSVIEKYFELNFPYAGNYWAADAASWSNVQEMQSTVFNSSGYGAIDTMLKHFQDKDYDFDWEQCKSGTSVGSQYDDCSDVVGLSSEFQIAATKVRTLMTGLDSAKQNIFLGEDYRLQKLLALIGDKFRQSVTYPMDKVSSDDTVFMKSYYSDHAIYNYRNINPVQPDMGNFSRSDFSHITPTNKAVNLISKKNFRSTGVYALPGQTMRITRNDNEDVVTKVFINSLRSGATHQYQVNGYNRPKYLQTPWFEIESGESMELTSPYGGPVHISFDSNDLNVSFSFENIAEHPYWASSADDSSFAQKLHAEEFDWAEVVTSGFEVHSKCDKMQDSVANEQWGTAEALAAATKKYMSNYPHVLAGFKGPGIDVVSEIHDFASDNNLTVYNLDLVKHMNADQATCGYGCSGNPYDAYWAFSPTGHGDVHELGHGLQKARFQYEGFENHSMTNPYSYYTKSKYNEITGGDSSCQNLPFREVFEHLQLSVNETNATEYLQENLWDDSGWSQQFMVTLQAMMHAQEMGKLENGWHLLARLHILEREISRIDDDWESGKASLGFSNYTLEEFNAMRKNDWLLVSLSFAAGLDYRDYLTMMGIEYSSKASSQVASFAYDNVPKKFFVSTSNGYCKPDDLYGAYLDKYSLVIDGNVSSWPDDSEYVPPIESEHE